MRERGMDARFSFIMFCPRRAKNWVSNKAHGLGAQVSAFMIKGSTASEYARNGQFRQSDPAQSPPDPETPETGFHQTCLLRLTRVL